MIAIWILAAVGGLALMLASSYRALHHLTAILSGTRIPPFVLGITLVAVGTDLPEIVNSIYASAIGQGDINVGDSIGSAATQVTLILGALPFVAGGFAVERRPVLVIGIATCLCLGLGAVFVSDGYLGRFESALLLASWIVGSAIAWQLFPASPPGLPSHDDSNAKLRHAMGALFFLGLVGAGSALAITALVEIAEVLAAPKYVISFLALSLGTSLPEFAIDLLALRRGHGALVIGDLFGSSFVDASLSISIGPLFFTNIVDAELALRGGTVALIAVIVAMGVLSIGARHNKWRGAVLLLAYAAFYPLLIG